MKRHEWWQRGCAWAAAAMFVVPMQAFAVQPKVQPLASLPKVQAARTPTVVLNKQQTIRSVDVALDADGRLRGAVLNVQGLPQVKSEVALTDGRKQVTTITNERGEFHFDHVATGSYQLRVGNQLKNCRVWKQTTAPPKANQGVMLVAGDSLVRGQVHCGSPVKGGYSGVRDAMSHPLVIAGVVGAAIAIPVAIHNSGDDDNSTATVP